MIVIRHDRLVVLFLSFTMALWNSTDLAASRALASDSALRVMSFNVRYSYGKPQEKAPENDWNDVRFPRRERVIRLIRQCTPDVLGVQEARHLQIVDLQEALPEYDFYGVGRDDGKTEGEFAGVFYRKQRFSRKDAGTFWLSSTPEQPGTSFYLAPNAVPRLASWIRLLDQQTNRELLVLNTHWDHVSEAARRQSATLIRKRLAALAPDLPAIVLGDLNTPEDSPAFHELVMTGNPGERTLIDSYRTVHPQSSPDEATFHDWKGTTAGSRIDFILHTDDFRATAADIVRLSYDGLWPSDHYPVTATLELPP
jgi:endonuclease/exonuclease/phosphatase family metal-dependent hydrolase